MPKTSKKAMDTNSLWQNRIAHGKKVKKLWKETFKVDTAIDYYEGRQRISDDVPESEWLTINKIYAGIQADLPNLYPEDPYFYVRLKRSYNPDPNQIALWDQRGKIRAAVLNYLKDQLKLKSKVRLAIQDAEFAFGIVKVRANVNMKDNPRAGKFAEDDEGTFLEDDEGKIIPEPDQIPLDAKYEIIRVHHDDFIYCPEAGTTEDTWPWLAQRIKTTVADIKKDKRFNQKAVNQLVAEANKADDAKNDDLQKSRENRKNGDIAGSDEGKPSAKPLKLHAEDRPVVYWEVWDLVNEEWLVVSEDADRLLMDPKEKPPGVKDHPYAILDFTKRDDSPYPIPPISQSISQQDEYNIFRSKMMTHLKRFDRKYFAQVGLLDEDNMSKLESGGDGTIIEGRGEGGVVPIKDAPLDQQNLLFIQMLDRDFVELLGPSSQARGVANADSASEAVIINRRQSVREGDKVKRVIDFTKEIAEKLDLLVQVHLDTEEAFLVRGPEGEKWAMATPEDYEHIEGEYEYSVNVGSTVPQLPEFERASFLAVLNTFAQFPHLMTSQRTMKQVFEMHHIDDEVMQEELREIGLKILSGQSPAPGQQGSQAGVSENRPTSASEGTAAGSLSLGQPGAGNIQG